MNSSAQKLNLLKKWTHHLGAPPGRWQTLPRPRGTPLPRVRPRAQGPAVRHPAFGGLGAQGVSKWSCKVFSNQKIGQNWINKNWIRKCGPQIINHRATAGASTSTTGGGPTSCSGRASRGRGRMDAIIMASAAAKLREQASGPSWKYLLNINVGDITADVHKP